jgi:bifunctional pyridoxal-dependent enzyme with beta-cystathionase and maltose regulon repressor activities
MAKVIISDKNARFHRLAERRVTETIRKLRLVGNLSNRHNYAYTDEHVKQILDALEAELKQVRARFRQEASTQNTAFSFKK